MALTDSLPGSQGIYTASLPYSGGTIYFALKGQNAAGEWSPASNNAFFPFSNNYLPILRR